MADTVDLKNVVKNLVNGTLEQTLCIVCLMPLDELCENIFTRICKEANEYCIADVFEQLFHTKFADTANFNVCSDCFISASSAYKFYLLAKRSNEILEFYVGEIEKNLNMVELPEDLNSYSICLSLPIFEPKTLSYDYDLEGLSMQDNNMENGFFFKYNIMEKEDSASDEDVLIVMKEDGKKVFYKTEIDGTLTEVKDTIDYGTPSPSSSEHKVMRKRRRKRLPMEYRPCSLCPVKYRFIAKLKEHMKVEHNVDLHVCKVCKAVMEDKEEFHNHLKTHTNIHICVVCDMVFKRRDTIIAHLKRHEELKNIAQTDGAHICEICGQVLLSEEYLKDHYDKKHDKKYTCYYCGRMYKGELSFNLHIKKHEAYMKVKDRKPPISDQNTIKGPVNAVKETGDRQYKCVTCNRDFVDQRALMWHTRLHTNERPYTCDVCGRGFVSVNRRNQHAVCAHTAPARRCPLCPALFHLRSMVNTHIKKVHLKAHKRRNRTSKYQDVFWRTETVPIQELSVDIQNDLLEMQTGRLNAYYQRGNTREPDRDEQSGELKIFSE